MDGNGRIINKHVHWFLPYILISIILSNTRLSMVKFVLVTSTSVILPFKRVWGEISVCRGVCSLGAQNADESLQTKSCGIRADPFSTVIIVSPWHYIFRHLAYSHELFCENIFFKYWWSFIFDNLRTSHAEPYETI